MNSIGIKAPVAGWLTPLSVVPDQAFAQGMVGEGVAIDPFVSELRAPCDGTISSIHKSLHACSVRAQNGAEVLLHIGVDSVALQGNGFVAHVKEGQRVATGDLLISFDMDLVAQKAKSLQTMVIISNSYEHGVVIGALDREVGYGDEVFSVDGQLSEESEGCVAPETESAEAYVKLMIASGLHARPAAALSSLSRDFSGEINIGNGAKSANAKSVVALMSLDTKHGDELCVRVVGNGAQAMVDQLVSAIEAGLGDAVVDVAQTQPAERANESKPQTIVLSQKPLFSNIEKVTLTGAGAVRGLATGQAVRLFHEQYEFSESGQGGAQEKARFEAALHNLQVKLKEAAQGASESAEIFSAHLSLLDDPEIIEGTNNLINDGKSAEYACSETLENMAQVFARLQEQKLAERAADLRDIKVQLLALLSGHDPRSVLQSFPEGGILVADEVLPSELVMVPAGRLAGIVMVAGGATSHVAIMAASMGIPTLVAVGGEASRIADEAKLIIDGNAGELRINPDDEELARCVAAVDKRRKEHEENRQSANLDCYSLDGERIEVFANLGHVEDAGVAVREGAEGCGLLRSEFLYIGRAQAPNEDEQLAQYQAIADALEGRPLIIRTLDAGGDKPLSYFPIAAEENPALGIRGVRATFQQEDLFRTQLRAILRVKPYGCCKIMVPMVTSVAELRRVKEMIGEESKALGREVPIEVGVMVEVPAAALTAETLAQEAAFFSVGTNDLTQYGLAMDRCNPALAAQTDALHPGVLRLIEQAAIGAKPLNRTVAVCGGAASDLAAVPILIGLGVTELSATPAVIADIKALIRKLSLAECRALAQAALRAESSEAVRRLVFETEVFKGN
ncbi:phosphoenolpyruvate--protein phosphotransferase [Polycladidibacter stylochi]|uniref:phosphoenolpyruvate--protein phosphotransferase n=1 Tax=Polycladidibacter stylochi TaxID=1807766 RepID=UPI00082A17E1|nr:phosphoenolpyruvate--protein phosphotransferase [Pseudovibrio stylochi]